jgi:hypothetical protein
MGDSSSIVPFFETLRVSKNTAGIQEIFLAIAYSPLLIILSSSSRKFRIFLIDPKGVLESRRKKGGLSWNCSFSVTAGLTVGAGSMD